MRVAVLSDVHGNSPALDAVLDDLSHQTFDAIVCLGDHVSGPIDPAGTADRLIALNAISIQGNHDRWVLDADTMRVGAIDRFARSRLSAEHLSWLAGLKATERLGDLVYLCHGTPEGDEFPWLDNFYEQRQTRLPSEAEVQRAADGIEAEVLLCGHTHIARSVGLRDGRLIVNPGSIGMQLVRGSPHAHYAVIEKRTAGWRVINHALPYDNTAAALLAEANGFLRWADAIRYGWAGPESLG